MMNVIPGTFAALILETALFLPRLEVVYSPNQPSGTYGVAIVAIEILIAVIVLGACNVCFTKQDAYRLLTALVLAIWSYSRVSFKYGLAFMVLLFWDKFRFLDLKLFHRSIIIAGLICSLWFDGSGVRWTGFLSTSAPVFAFTLNISVVYLLFSDKCNGRKTVDLVLVSVAIYLIWKTETRLFMVSSIGLILVRLMEYINYSNFIEKQYKTVIIRTLYLCLLLLLLTNIDWLYETISRDTGAASERTRFEILIRILPTIAESPVTLFLGHGGGFAEGITEAAVGVATNVPLHQDIVTYVVDYGLVGTLLIALAFFRGVHWNWYLWALLFTASFHNVLTSGSTLLLMYVTFQSICHRNELHENGVLQ